MSSPEKEHFISPNSSTDLRSDANQSQIKREQRDWHQTNMACTFQDLELNDYKIQKLHSRLEHKVFFFTAVR